MDKVKRIKELTRLLNEASIAYYNSGHIIMSDAEFDILYKDLEQLETECRIVLVNSPTSKVGAEVKSELETVKHNHPMLSLDKCHTTEELIEFADVNDMILMMKLDGLSISLEYQDGKLISGETRGDGEEGSDVLHNILVFKNVPKTISYKGNLIIDGESIITYQDFDKINSLLPEDKQYKNPRNLASGSTMLLDSGEAVKRHLRFVGWKVVKGLEEIGGKDSNFFKLKEIEKLGFDITPMWTYSNNSSDKENISKMLSDLKIKAEKLGYPIDGAVMAVDSISKGNSMGRTSKFFRHSIAYKFEDDEHKTKLLDVEWTMGRTGVLTPTAIFEPCEIDGTTVSRASLHNISIMEQLKLKIGCVVDVYKANCIIPQIRSAEPSDGLKIEIPNSCPICNSDTEIKAENNTKTLHCSNLNCKGKLLGALSHFASKNAMDIDGLSEKTLEKFIEKDWVNGLYGIYNLKVYKDEMMKLEGFGKKSVDKLLTAIENSKTVKFENFLFALGIPLIGRSASKTISKFCSGDKDNFERMIVNHFDFTELDDFGSTMSDAIVNWFRDDINSLRYYKLSDLLTFENSSMESNKTINKVLDGKSLCITGKLIKYPNRDALVVDIERNGAKVVSGVTSKTDFLLTNDILSGSSKNTKAKQLNIPIITEEEFIKMVGE
jgi:DNA ligase (NAD+)